MNTGMIVSCFWIALSSIQFFTACLAPGLREPGNATGAGKERIVLFPGESIGKVVIADWNSLLTGGRGEEPQEATGKIRVPAGKVAVLLYHGLPHPSGDRPVDFSSLDSLRPRDIEGFAVPFGRVEPRGLARIMRFGSLRMLGLSGFNHVGDDCLPVIGKLTGLRLLYLPETGVTDSGIRSLANLSDLEVLGLYGTGITDRGLEAIVKLGRLRVLDLSRTQVTDAGLKGLASLARLEKLDLSATAVSEKARKELKQKLPRLKIVFRQGER